MKISLVLFCFLCATTALGQSVSGGSALSAEPQVLQFPSHPARAMQQAMGERENILESSTIVSARGERPLWEVAPKRHEVPLGDVARMFRKEHATAKKAVIVWDN
jgi:hypothetical protein